MDTKHPLIEFPCSYPLKVMGPNSGQFESAVRAVLDSHLKTGPVTYSNQPSSGGKYLSITAVFTATSRQQLDAIYQALNDHELVVMTL